MNFQYKPFVSYFKGKFGNHKLLYSFEIEAIDSDKVLQEPVDWEKVKYVELRTHKLDSYLNRFRDFCKFKLRGTWTKSYFTKTNQVVFGFQDNHGIVSELQSYTMAEVKELGKVCFYFSYLFLNKYRPFLVSKRVK